MSVALIFAVLMAATVRLVTVKLADVAPAATVTVAGTLAAAVLLLDSVTVLCAAVPTAGAFSVTVPTELAAPPGTVVGFRVTIATVGILGCGLSELPGHRAQQPPEVFHQAIEVLEIEGLRAV